MIRKFKFTGDDIRRDLADRYGYTGDLAEIYAGHQGTIVHKWHHYLPLYDRYLSRYRGKPLKFLEIGVSKGGSLAMWRRYFGDSAVIFGIDIDPACAAYDGVDAQVRIGSQDDTKFLDRVVKEMGGVDVVLDDGSHFMNHIRATLSHLFPKLADDGIYMIEDLHTAYWRRWGGGDGTTSNFFNEIRPMIDDLHRWYRDDNRVRSPALGGNLSGLHIHDSLLVIDKWNPSAPTHSQVGIR